MFAVRAACAAAASELRDEVEQSDLEIAVRLVILPRATRIPQQEPDEAPPPPDQQPPDSTPDSPEDNQEPPPPPPEQSDDDDSESEAAPPPDDLVPPPEQILEALEAELPAELDDLTYQHVRRGQSGSRGSTDGNRGRHVRSVPGNPGRNRIDIIATLRAAAPWQKLREQAPNQPDNLPEKNVYLASSDIRVKKYRSKAGALFCFAVDASGSMALHRMRQAKGAVHTLLERAYVKRDKVALLAFRGEQAELLMPPTQSVELAKKALDLLPTGGGTPLASALLLGCDVAEQAKMRGIMQTVLVLLTDGRGNIPLKEGAKPQEELEQLGGYVRDSGVHVVVVDTKRSYLSRGEARQLAEWLGGDYAYLPNASGEDIGEFVAALRG
jgi:magnesium chelatase subunit D